MIREIYWLGQSKRYNTCPASMAHFADFTNDLGMLYIDKQTANDYKIT